MRSVLQKPPHSRQGELTAEEEADFAQMKRARTEQTGRAISTRRRRSSGSEGQRGPCDRGNGDGGLQCQEKEPNANDEEVSQVMKVAQALDLSPPPVRRSGRGNRDSWRRDAGQDATYSERKCKNLPPMHDLSRAANRIIKPNRWQCGFTRDAGGRR